METRLETKFSDQLILVKETQKGKLLKSSEILYVKAQDNYSRFYLTNDNKITICRSLKSCEEELDPDIFFRCHKSYIVNLHYIKEYLSKGNKFILILRNQVKINVARRRISRLKKLLQTL
jgi:two-component system, LytTR family, response regulator